jgi:hypothetical protein
MGIWFRERACGGCCGGGEGREGSNLGCVWVWNLFGVNLSLIFLFSYYYFFKS